MKIETKRNISNVVCVISALAMIMIIVLSSLHLNGIEGRPELFINDKPWYNSAKYPIEVIDGVVYVPATAFAELSNIIMNSSRELDVFYIDNTSTGKFISFDRNNDYAFLNNEELVSNIKTYLYGDVIYIPLTFVSSAINVTVSQYKSISTNTTYYRICNGTQKLSFDELLKLYKPSALNPSDTTSKVTDKITSPPPKTEESTYEEIDPVFVYLTFNGIPGTDSHIFDILKEHDVPAAFFVDSEDIKANITGLLKIHNEGYPLVLTDNANTSSDNFNGYLSYLNETNQLLARILKIKTHLVSKYNDEKFAFRANDLYDLSKNGFVLWNINIDFSSSTSSGSSIFRNIKKQLSDTVTPVISLGINEKAEDALERLIEYFDETGYYIPSELSLYSTEINTLSQEE